MEKNIFLVIEYRGKNYSGWQRQKNGLSVQEVIENALFKLTNQEIKLIGSGRTDAKVNALGQCANFRIDSSIPASRFYMALNSLLPEDIRILTSYQVDENFHSRYSAVGKHYRYTILNRSVASAIYKDSTYHVRQDLDVDKMIKAASFFVGEHDFRAFMASGSNVKNTVRTIYTLDITKDGPLIHIDIVGNGFLYNMVRIIAGTLLQVGKGEVSWEKVMDIILSKNRQMSGPTLRAQGLCLVEVFYN